MANDQNKGRGRGEKRVPERSPGYIPVDDDTQIIENPEEIK